MSLRFLDQKFFALQATLGLVEAQTDAVTPWTDVDGLAKNMVSAPYGSEAHIIELIHED